MRNGKVNTLVCPECHVVIIIYHVYNSMALARCSKCGEHYEIIAQKGIVLSMQRSSATGKRKVFPEDMSEL